jgi:hypothetical protein|tara:strand:- start:34 stop:276 length:243 start_codon:yes stop_codon:yes gene_type:complete
MKTTQDKRADFKRLLIPRLDKAIKAIKVIGNLSASQYAFTEGEAEKVIQALRLATDQVEGKFFKKDAPLVAIEFDHTEAD